MALGVCPALPRANGRPLGEGRRAPAPACHKLLCHTAKEPGHQQKTHLTRNPSRKSSKSNAVLSRVGVEVDWSRESEADVRSAGEGEWLQCRRCDGGQWSALGTRE